MNVTESTPKVGLHSIEWGDGSWPGGSRSIRNRYDTASGRFNKAASGEIPWDNFKQMISESIQRGQLSNAELADIMKEISDKLRTL